MHVKPYFAKTYHGLRSIWSDIVQYDLFRLASAMAYTTLLSIVPSLAVFFSLITVFYPVSGEQSKVLSWLQHKIFEHLATGSGEAVFSYLTSFISQINFAKIGVTGFASLLATLILLVRQVENAFNRIFGAKQERNFFTRLIYFWTLATLGGLILSLGITVLTKLAKSMGLSHGGSFDLEAFKIWGPLISLFINFSIFFVLYKILPNCEVKYREAFTGAIFASFAIFFTSKFYGQNISSLTSYQSLYGALAALPLFLLWLYISWVIALLGAVVAKKSSSGFLGKSPQVALADSIAKSLGTQEYGHLRIGSLLPVVVLVVLYRLAQSKRDVVNLSMINQNIKLPAKFIDDAIMTLLSLGYIHIVNQEGKKSHPMKGKVSKEVCYYYSLAPESIDLNELSMNLSLPTKHEIQHFFGEVVSAEILSELEKFLAKRPAKG